MFKFKIGDLVRPITASKKSRTWKVVKQISPTKASNFVSSIAKREIVITNNTYLCSSFAYNKEQVKSFEENEIELIPNQD